MRALPLLLCLLASPAASATVTLDLNPADFAKVADGAPCGSGRSVIADGCAPVAKSDPTAPDAYGRFDPWGGTWVDSQDLARVDWTIRHPEPFTSLTFALTDAWDQPHTSRFSIRTGDQWFIITDRQANGALDWVTFRWDAPITSAVLRFTTTRNDGWGVSAATVETLDPPAVPLPATGALMLGALGMLAMGRRR